MTGQQLGLLDYVERRERRERRRLPMPPSQPVETSRAAARSIQRLAPTLRHQVFEFLRGRPQGATDEEIQLALNLNPSTERPRRIELQRTGMVRDSGRKRRTTSGRLATVWEIV